jgi:transcriptional regulator with XRE-family HTH domain
MSRDEATPTLGRCGDCGSQIVLKIGPGRVREYLRGVWLAVPNDFGTPACVHCGAEYMVPEISEPLDDLLGKQLTARVSQCAALIQARDNVTQQQIEDALGITRSYLSHLRAGRKEPSATLVKLLEVCALFSECFQHVREQRPFEVSMVGLFLVGSGKQFRPGTDFRALRGYEAGYSAPVNDVDDVPDAHYA